MKELPPNGVCPFCGGELHTDDSDDESYMAAINAEIRRIASELTVIAARECKIVCVNRYCMNLLYAPYWGKQR